MPDVSVTMPGRRNRMKMSAEDAYEVPEPGFRYENVFFVSKINASLRKCIFLSGSPFSSRQKVFFIFFERREQVERVEEDVVLVRVHERVARARRARRQVVAGA